MRNKVKIIVCYYGKFPDYMSLWLASCGNNKEFDFLIVTDTDIDDKPSNVSVLLEPLERLRRRFEHALKRKVILESPYKLCDYRPIYGLAFADKLEDYDFWGHCDLDMLWGNLSHFLNDSILDCYDIIGKRGAFILYRNNCIMNELYRKRGGIFSYKEVFSSNENYGFDEMTGMNLIAEFNKVSRYCGIKIGDALRGVSRITVRGTQRCREFFCMVDGSIFRVYEEKNSKNVNVEEYTYLHFSEKNPAVDIQQESYNNFYIKSKSFAERKRERFSIEELNYENEFRSVFAERKENIIYKLKKLSKMIFQYSWKKKIILLKLYSAIRVKKCL